ncbi:DUF6114 domain-containing protein [Micromonospora sp. DT233]|uniref:DUF6114 domain-containing protein n=1 Tax=Micromonospora sp. DT233 TaxID=3393432 RepID=UPI003CF406F5
MTDAGTARPAAVDGTAPTIGAAGTAGDGLARRADADGTARPADADGTARSGRAGGRWRAWRRSRPFWGGLLVVLGAVEMLVTLRAPLPVILHVGPQGLAGYLVPVILLLCGVLLVAQPAQRVFYALISLVLALASWLTSNMGGFVVGMLLALVGGCLAFAWTPVKPPRTARQAATDPATDADAGPVPDTDAGPAPGAVVGTAPGNDATAEQNPYSRSAPQADWVASSQPSHLGTTRHPTSTAPHHGTTPTPYTDEDGRHRRLTDQT